MAAFGSTLIGHAAERKSVLHPLVVRILGRSPRAFRPEELAALLLPMVVRTVRTRRGPAALVRWLRQSAKGHRPASQTEQAARKLTEDLVRVLFEPPGSPDDTLENT